MKIIPLLFCISSLNAAVIVQDHNDEFGVRTTIELNNSIYTYRYDVKTAPFIDMSRLGTEPIDRVFSLWTEDSEGTIIFSYVQSVPINGNFTVQFESTQAPIIGNIQNQVHVLDNKVGWNTSGWVPSIPEPSFVFLCMIASMFNLTRRFRH